MVPNPIEYNDPSPSPNFKFPVFEAEEESDVEMSDELSRLLEQDEKTIQSFEEQIELVNLGSEDDVKEEVAEVENFAEETVLPDIIKTEDKPKRKLIRRKT